MPVKSPRGHAGLACYALKRCPTDGWEHRDVRGPDSSNLERRQHTQLSATRFQQVIALPLPSCEACGLAAPRRQ